VLEQF